MAMSDYCLCEVCGMKTFYDANLNYEPSDKAREDGGCSLERTAAMSAICKDCWTKGYRLKVVSIEDDDEVARLRADLANAGAVMVEACARACDRIDDQCGMEAGLAASCAETVRALSTLSPIAAAARVLLEDRAALTELAITTMRANRLNDGKRIGYQPALECGLRALAEQEKADD